MDRQRGDVPRVVVIRAWRELGELRARITVKHALEERSRVVVATDVDQILQVVAESILELQAQTDGTR